jgi:acyl-CoA synthetase (AMP-forming)/AMP-acid ligase II
VADCDASAPALLTFTSGSTGPPKGAVRTHGLLRAQYEALRENLALRPGQVDLATLPVFVLANLAAGVTTVLADADLRAPAQIDAGPIVDQIRAEGPTRTTASPAVFERLMDAEAGVLDRFERLYTGGAPVFPDLLGRLREAAPTPAITAVYGSTEAEPIAHVSESEIGPAERRRMVEGGGLLAGRPVDAVELRILPDRWGTPIGPVSRAELEARACPPGTPGEIVVAGPHVVPGYLDGQGEATTKFEGGGTRWHRTGDAGRLDEEGRLWLLGRCDATVRDDRGVLHPFAVECGARLHDDVRHAALAQRDGRRVLAVEPAAPRRGVDRQGLRDQLADVVLDAVVVLSTIPLDRRHNAKVDYPALHDRLAEAT